MVDHLLFDRSKWIKDPVGTSVTVPTSINLYQSYGDDVKKSKSYTGKNTVCRVLAKRIYCAVEIDGQTYYIKPQDLIFGGYCVGSKAYCTNGSRWSYARSLDF